MWALDQPIVLVPARLRQRRGGSPEPRPALNTNVDHIAHFSIFDCSYCGPARFRNPPSSPAAPMPRRQVNVDPSRLAVSKLVLEVDTRWGDYADCNVDPGTGEYSCDCEDAPDNCTTFTQEHPCDYANGCAWDRADDRCETYGCTNITDRDGCTQGYHHCRWDTTSSRCLPPPGPTPVCNRSLVGHLDLSQCVHATRASPPPELDRPSRLSRQPSSRCVQGPCEVPSACKRARAPNPRCDSGQRCDGHVCTG